MLRPSPRSLWSAAAAALVLANLRSQCALAWTPPAAAPNAGVYAVQACRNGDLVVGGAFTTFAGVPANCLARRSGGTWSQLGGGVNGVVSALVEMPNGDLVVAGAFTQAGATPVQDIARWNGSTWSPLGSGVPGVLTMAAAPNGDLFVGGFLLAAGGVPAQRVARWDGANWSALGQGTTLPVNAIAVRANGDVAFTSWDGAQGSVTRLDVWNGTGVVNVVSQPAAAFRSLAVLPGGDLVVGGYFHTLGTLAANGLARWNGTTWTALPVGAGSNVYAIDVLPDGDLLLGGNIQGPGGGYRLARWSNGVVIGLEAPVPPPGGLFGVTDQTVLAAGEIAVCGSFTSIGTSNAAFFASLQTNCPATATPFGLGCTGSGGANLLAATALPWTGGTFRSRATGMPALGAVALVTGFTSFAIPLAAVFQSVAPGCVGYVSPDWIDVQLPVGGQVTGQLPIPANPALVGVGFHQYALPLEFDALGNLIAITSSNGLSMTIGSF